MALTGLRMQVLLEKLTVMAPISGLTKNFGLELIGLMSNGTTKLSESPLFMMLMEVYQHLVHSRSQLKTVLTWATSLLLEDSVLQPLPNIPKFTNT